MKPIKLSVLLEALEFDSPDYVTRIDTQNGCFVFVEECLLRAVENREEVRSADGPEWRNRDAELARAIVEDPGERFVSPPSKFEFHEYRHMERFISTVESDQAAEELWHAIKGRGAFRCFKDTAARFGLLDGWFEYRQEAMRQFAIGWAKNKKIPYVDDAKGKGKA